MVATIIISGDDERGYSCYMLEDLPNYMLVGYGKTIEECKQDMLNGIPTIQKDAKKEGWKFPHLDFQYVFAEKEPTSMDITVMIEQACDGSYSCAPEEDVPVVGLIGVGDTLEEMKKDFMICIEEAKQYAYTVNKVLPYYNITWKMAS